MAEALDAEKRRASEAAHALRTPVAVLVARLETPPAGETTDRLRADIAHLSRTVRQVINAGRADALQMPRAAPLNPRLAIVDRLQRA
ncbi:MAG: hypothetical protein AAF416_20525 [Pseudomonadota bacterium]